MSPKRVVKPVSAKGHFIIGSLVSRLVVTKL
jgi:hypothetical protein